MAISLGQRLKATRELLSMTQEQVIEQLENRFDIVISQQTLSTIETGKRRVDAEKELPAFAAIYSRPIDYFYENLSLPPAASSTSSSRIAVASDFEALTQRDKLMLAVELIHNVLQES
ncbi:MAG: helix-turn-helix transcriptional regulator [Leptolyngbyaceae cyanobacterium bins.302]|nr:helix-turn-helix transcriptional regulator [Leptolyngbyaceae cyanobacterium bins.302]